MALQELINNKIRFKVRINLLILFYTIRVEDAFDKLGIYMHLTIKKIKINKKCTIYGK